jgi:hypothetical protein
MSTLTVSICARASASVLPRPCTFASTLISLPLPPVTLTSPATFDSFRLPPAPTLKVRTCAGASATCWLPRDRSWCS